MGGIEKIMRGTDEPNIRTYSNWYKRHIGKKPSVFRHPAYYKEEEPFVYEFYAPEERIDFIMQNGAPFDYEDMILPRRMIEDYM